MKCDCCSKNSNDLSLVKDYNPLYETLSFEVVCKDCYNNNEIVFKCSNCKTYYFTDGNVIPCFKNNGTCPTLCYRCFDNANILLEKPCGCFTCRNHKDDCDCCVLSEKK